MTDQREIDKCVMLLVRDYGAIKDAFLIAASESGCYPNISKEYMLSFCKKHRIMSSSQRHRFEEADLEEIFEETNKEWVEDEDDANPDDLLNRSEFLEILMRIAQRKYSRKPEVGPGDGDQEEAKAKEVNDARSRASAASDGLARILSEVIIPISDHADIAGFRENRCHDDARVCQTIMQNYVSIQQLYQRYL